MIFGREKKIPMTNETNSNSLGNNLESGVEDSKKANFGTANFLLELENRRSIKVCEKRLMST